MSEAHASLRGPVFFGLGANLGDRELALRTALRWLEEIVGPLSVASLYRSSPVTAADSELPPQPDYFNTVARADLEQVIDARALLFQLKALEKRAGRRPAARDAARRLDIDILVAGDHQIDLSEVPLREGLWPGPLKVPHARLRERLFVLEPLVELASELRLPPDGTSATALLSALTASQAGAQQRVDRLDWGDPL